MAPRGNQRQPVMKDGGRLFPVIETLGWRVRDGGGGGGRGEAPIRKEKKREAGEKERATVEASASDVP